MQNTHPHLNLVEQFNTIPDPRVDRTKDHDLVDILVIAIGALLGRSAGDAGSGINL